MPKDEKPEETFNVVDRRRFTSAGEVRPDAEVRPAPPPEPTPEPPREPARSAAPPPPPESGASRQARKDYEELTGRSRRQKVDFPTVVLSLSTSAMFHLGLVDDPLHGPSPVDLEGARHTIDILAVIEEKTRGNLTPQEKQLLEQALYELRLSYAAVASGQHPGGKPRAGA